MELIYVDKDIVVCVKPARVLSTDEPGGLPELVRQALDDDKADVRTVHRLDRVVSGLMVLARNAPAASALSRQIRSGRVYGPLSVKDANSHIGQHSIMDLIDLPIHKIDLIISRMLGIHLREISTRG